MNLSIYCVHDSATDVLGTPMFLISHAQALRSFSDEVNRVDKDNQLYVHPDDFDLYVLGSWDNTTGLFEVTTPTVLVRGKDVSLSYKEKQ